MSLETLYDFFSNELDETKQIVIHNSVYFNKKKITKLIKKYINIASNIKDKECVVSVADNFLFMIIFFALLHAGKKIIIASNTRESTIKNLGAKHLFTDEPVSYKNINSYKLDLLLNDDDIKDVPINPIDIKKAEIVFFTSGSTGAPKRISKSFNSLCAELTSVDILLSKDVEKTSTVITTVNIFHLYGMTFAFLYALAKGIMVDTKRIDTPEELSQKLYTYKNSILISSPAFLDRLARYKDSYSFENKPVLIMSSGGPLSEVGANGAFELFATNPCEIFGSTETGAVANRKQLENKAWKFMNSVEGSIDIQGQLVVKSDYIDGNTYTMADAVELIDSRHFLLNGRLDRMVKIEEKRVSLPEIEAILHSHNFVDKAYCMPVFNGNLRLTIGACISLNKKGREFLLSKGRKELVSELKSYISDDADKISIPTKWRLVDEIPMNSQSKISTLEISQILQSNIPEPIVLGKTTSEDSAELELAFLESSSYFEGHFPSFALLPAVVQIDFAIYFAHKLWPDLIPSKAIDIEKMSRIKFSNMIRPNIPVSLILSKTDKSMSFKYKNDNLTYSSGTIVLRSL